jgi:hypothetical protein
MAQTQQTELQHEDSIHSQDPNADENKKGKKNKSRRPPSMLESISGIAFGRVKWLTGL